MSSISLLILTFLAGTYGPRILRLYEVTNFSVHDLALVDCKNAFSSLWDIANNFQLLLSTSPWTLARMVKSTI